METKQVRKQFVKKTTGPIHERQPKIVGLGGAMVDTKVNLTEDQLKQLGVTTKGGSMLVNNAKELNAMLEKIVEFVGEDELLRVPGGSGCNVLKSLSALGANAGYISKVGNDKMGTMMREALLSRQTQPYLGVSENYCTGEVLCLVTPDGERTMRGFLGATLDLNEKDIPDLSDCHHMHVEGYNVYDKPLTEAAFKAAKKAGLSISFDLGSFELVKNNRDYLIEVISKYVDICFANEEESTMLFEVDCPREALNKLSELCSVAVVTLGKEGCIVKQHDDSFHYPAVNRIIKPVDTTGAGDLFCAGFLYGFLHGHSLETAAKLGSMAGFHVIQSLTTELSDEVWRDIKSIIQDRRKSDEYFSVVNQADPQQPVLMSSE